MKKFLEDEDKFQDYILLKNQKFPSSRFGYDERFAKLKKQEEDYKKNLQYQDIRFNNFETLNNPTSLPISPRSEYRKEKYIHQNKQNNNIVTNKKRRGFISVPPKIQSITHYGTADMNVTEKDIQNVMNYLNNYDKFDESNQDDILDISSGNLGLFNQHFKSTGYPSTFENAFYYVSDDLQLPEHTCNERGFPSRSLNKSINKQREIFP